MRTPVEGAREAPRELLLDEILRSAVRRFRTRVATWRGRDVALVQRPFAAKDLDALLEIGEASPCLWAAFGVEGAPPVVLLVEMQLLRVLVGQLYGGADDEMVTGSEGPTEVERSVGLRICRELLESMLNAWTGGDPPAVSIQRVVVAPSARVCRNIDLETAYDIGGVEVAGAGAVHIAVPATVAPVRRPSAADRPLPVAREPRYDRLLPVEVEIVAELARLQIPLGRVLGLNVGDELPLGLHPEAILRVGDRAALVGEPGERAGIRSVRVTGRCSSSTPVMPDR
jgi:flagellar motor switch protein FliM